jgi:hypothetical protein
MSLVAGTVVVASDESVTGAGYARALYDADVATTVLPAVPGLGVTTPPFTPARPSNTSDQDTIKAGRLATLRELARRANAQAAATVSYFTANAVIPASGINDSTAHACTGSAQLT